MKKIVGVKLSFDDDDWVELERTSGLGLDDIHNFIDERVKPKAPLIKDEKIRKAVRAWVEAENCTSEMNLYYTLNRQEKYIIFHNPQTGSELQLCEFDYPDFKELCEYTIAELCGEEEE